MLERYWNSSPELSHRNRYTRFQQKLNHEETSDSPIKAKQAFPLNLLLFTAVLLLIALFCHISYSAFIKSVKSVAYGLVAIFFSWEVVYFDSTFPGVFPPSPLKFPNARESVRALHTSYLFSIINGVLLTIMIFLWT